MPGRGDQGAAERKGLGLAWDMKRQQQKWHLAAPRQFRTVVVQAKQKSLAVTLLGSRVTLAEWFLSWVCYLQIVLMVDLLHSTPGWCLLSSSQSKFHFLQSRAFPLLGQSTKVRGGSASWPPAWPPHMGLAAGRSPQFLSPEWKQPAEILQLRGAQFGMLKSFFVVPAAGR